jgi:hypothetical protein
MWHFREPDLQVVALSSCQCKQSFIWFAHFPIVLALFRIRTWQQQPCSAFTVLTSRCSLPPSQTACASSATCLNGHELDFPNYAFLFPLCCATRLHISRKATRFSVSTPSLLASKKNNSPERAPRAYRFRPIRRWLALGSGPFGRMEVRGLVFDVRISTCNDVNNNGEELRWSRGRRVKREKKLLESGGFFLTTISLIRIGARVCR